MDRHRRTDVGTAGEAAAAGWLAQQGLTVVGRNVRHGRDEADLVAEEASTGCLVVVEVKTRSNALAWPELRVDQRKAAALIRLTRTLMLLRHGCPGARIDVVGVNLPPGGEPRFCWFREAIPLPVAWTMRAPRSQLRGT